MSTSKPRRLGRGLNALLSTTDQNPVSVNSVPAAIDASPGKLREDTGSGEILRLVPVESVTPSPFQPRRVFDAAELDQLAASIARSGVMQPIIVRPLPSGDHELVAGERRWRAARQAGLDRVPALVRSLDDETAAEWALVENLQRTDLNAMERARALRGLIDRFGLTQGEVADRVGLERSSVTNLVRLLELESALQDLIEGGALSFGHGRALLAAREGSRLDLAERCIREGWSVRRLEREAVALDQRKHDVGVDGDSGSRAEVASPGAEVSPEIRDLERRLGEYLGTAVNIRTSGDGSRGKVVLSYYSLAHFDDVMSRLGLPAE